MECPNAGFEWIEGRTGPDGITDPVLLPRSLQCRLSEIPSGYCTFSRTKIRADSGTRLSDSPIYWTPRCVQASFPFRPLLRLRLANAAKRLVDFEIKLSGRPLGLLSSSPMGTTARACELPAETHIGASLNPRKGPGYRAMRVLSQINEKHQPQARVPERCFLKTCKGDMPTKLQSLGPTT